MSKYKAKVDSDGDKFKFTIEDDDGNVVDEDTGYWTQEQATYHASESRDLHNKEGDWADSSESS